MTATLSGFGEDRMTHPLADLLERSRRPSRLVVGLMSGTSADSIDVAVCRMTGHEAEVAAELLDYREQPHDPEVRRRIIGVAGLDVRGLAELHVLVGESFAAACLSTLDEARLSPRDVDLVGSHGQTVYHHSGVAGAIRATLQVGDGDVIAVRTGCPVISDFRARDVAAGGEARALSPIADAILFGRGLGRNEGLTPRRAILNLGGIANLTVLDDDPALRVRLRHRPGQCAARPAGAADLRRGARLRPRRPARPLGPR